MLASVIQPQIFINDAAGFVIRIVERPGELWFVAADVARALNYRDAATAIRMLDDDEKDTHRLCTPGGTQEMTIISESGLYALVIRSNKPEAKIFRRWVTREVLPQIRKTGGYGKPIDLDAIFAFLNEERDARIQFQSQLLEQMPVAPRCRAPLADVRAKILAYVIQAGSVGLPRRVLSNRVRESAARQIALSALLADGTILEILRNRKHIFISPAFLKTE